ncbi:MAG: hypothetical protein KDI83_16560 [Gammaproteobacteria bacterium]|nr:hypothetical protein [Gammaproteobacteria bacterium]
MDEKRYLQLTRFAIALTAVWICWTIFDSGMLQKNPVVYALEAARKNLEDGSFEEALLQYRELHLRDSDNLAALRGMAQALVQLGKETEMKVTAKREKAKDKRWSAADHYKLAMSYYDQVIARESALESSPDRQRVLGVDHANRGILRDLMGDYPGALTDYDRSLQLEPEVAEGPGFMTRFMRNQAERPPTIADRADYLRRELAKPKAEQLLRMPTLDARQRAYSMD